MKPPKAGVDDYAARGAESEIGALPRTDVTAAPRCTRTGDELLYTWDEADVQITVTMLRDHGDGGPTAEVAVAVGGRELHWGALGLASTVARGTLVKRLAAQHRPLPWGSLLDQTCRLAVQALRAGAPDEVLSARAFVGPRLAIDPFVWHTGASFIFADGGSGKGWVALVAALAARTARAIAGIHCPVPGGLRVLYLDWEASADDLNDRLHRLGRGLSLETAGLIPYLGMIRPLSQDLPRVRAAIAKHAADVLILDSWALACGVGRDTSGLDTTVGAFQALRALGRPALAVAHLSKTMADTKAAARIYGSVFNNNLSRNVWELKRSLEAPDGIVQLGAYHSKVNDVRPRAPFGLTLTFDGDTGPVSIAKVALRASGGDLLDKLPLGPRLLQLIAPLALTVEELAEKTGEKEATIRQTLVRYEDKGRVVRVGDSKPFRWGRPATP